MRPAGMLHGRVVRPPRYGATLNSVDESTVKAMKGGLEIPAESGGDAILIANAAVIVSLEHDPPR